eukprot:CAMPEP_0170544450 /NCGR_PEP_ID=MMETSP0211-20121228/3209_1 /TAXON_ID=311385 /ORGANISM="Pseudokeronopsis sp., Strain OXSARD2" /LENGTH=155 /DNA_ID=CAMNT_0010848107 /DNA_START=1334 /DNA_END=1801 /DNA_ORIENTATION=-
MTPAVLLGYEEDVRNQKFNEVINELNGHFEEHKGKASKLIEAKKTAKNKQEAEMIHKAAQGEIGKANEFKKLIAVVNAKKGNKWQAPPITHYETDFIRKEKVNEDVPAGKIKISFKTSKEMANSGMLYIKYNLNLSENCKIKGHFEIDKDQEVMY